MSESIHSCCVCYHKMIGLNWIRFANEGLERNARLQACRVFGSRNGPWDLSLGLETEANLEKCHIVAKMGTCGT
jgi:hypothetical protein